MSIYTRYLIEGIETSAADSDQDGMISVDELHDYAKQKVQEEIPAMKPEIYAIKEGYKIILGKAIVRDCKFQYAQKAKKLLKNGTISPIGRLILEELRQQLNMTPQEANLLEQEVLEPFLKYQEKLQTYEKAYQQLIALKNPNENFDYNELKQLQQILGLKTEDITSIETKFKPKPLNAESLANSQQPENNKININTVSNYPSENIESLSNLEGARYNNKDINTVSNRQSKFANKSPLNIDFINSCKKELAMFIGPMASFIVEDIFAEFPDLTESQLIEKLAKEIPNQQQATEFIAKFK